MPRGTDKQACKGYMGRYMHTSRGGKGVLYMIRPAVHLKYYVYYKWVGPQSLQGC